MKFKFKNLLFPAGLITVKLIYDEAQGKSCYELYTTLKDKISVYAEEAKKKKPKECPPRCVLPEGAEYAEDEESRDSEKRKRLFVAHMYCGSTKSLIDTHIKHLCKHMIDPEAEMVYCPSACYLQYAKENLPDCIELGIQNIYPKEEGNYTGEVSPAMAVDIGAKYVLIGASHRRMFLGETDKFIKAKITKALEAGLKCILFLSNPTSVSDDHTTDFIIGKQLSMVAPSIEENQWTNVAIACEPPREDDSTPQDQRAFKSVKAAQRMCRKVRKVIADHASEEIANEVRILYAGDICHSTAPLYMAQKDIDGAVFCARGNDDCFINIINSGLLVDMRKEKLEAEKKKDEPPPDDKKKKKK